MKFVYPEFLWALTALLVPIIIHLFNFRKYKTLYFSSLQFVQHIEQRSKSTQRLKNILILILRLLAFTAIVFAFAQPYFNDSSSSQSQGKDIIALHIDNSFSMTMKGAEGELLSEAKESARKIIEKAPLNTRILLSTNTLDGIESRLTTKIDALDRLDKISTSPMVRSFDEVINWQKKNLSHSFENNEIGRVQHIILSDFQQNTTTFTDLKADSVSSYIPIVFNPQTSSNLSIDSVWFSSPLHKKGIVQELNIKVSNSSDVPLQNIQLSFELGNKKRDLFIDIDAHSSANSSISYTDNNFGVKSGKISLQDQQFYADDEYFFTYEVAKQSKIVVINGESANNSVAAIYRLDNFYDVQEINAGQYTQSVLSNANLVVLNGLNDIPSGLNDNLIDYWNNGGTVALFPGSSINTNNINRFLQALQLPSIQKLITQNARIKQLNYKDPFFKGVFEKEKENLSLPAVSKFYLTNTATETNALDIIQLQNGKPLFIRSDGEKQAFLFASSLQAEFGSFTSDILFTTILLRMGELSMRNGPIALTIGEEGKFPIYQKLADDRAIHLKGNNIDFIPQTLKNNEVTYIDISGSEATATLSSGIYSIEADQQLGQVALNYNRKESNIQQLTQEEITQKLTEQGISRLNVLEVNDGASVTNLSLDKPYPYWKLFLIAALIFLIAEIGIIKFVQSDGQLVPPKKQNI